MYFFFLVFGIISALALLFIGFRKSRYTFYCTETYYSDKKLHFITNRTESDIKILVIPGNPGFCKFYDRFISEID